MQSSETLLMKSEWWKAFHDNKLGFDSLFNYFMLSYLYYYLD